MNKVAYVFIPSSYNGPCITESGPKVFEFILKNNNYKGDFFTFNLDWNESVHDYMDRITKEFKNIIKKYNKVIVFGGNHLSLLPVYNVTSSINYNSLTLDAHRDYLHNDGLITHGSFLRLIKKNNTKRFLIGYRDKISDKEKYDFFYEEISAKQYKNDTYINCENIKYVDIDVDVLDKKIFPFTPCILENGLFLNDIFKIFEKVNINEVKILSFSEYAYALDRKKKGLKIIIKIINQFLS